MAKVKALPKNASQDITIAAAMTVGGLLSDQGLKAVQGVLQGAKDPAAAIAHVIFMALAKVREKLEEQNIDIDPKVWIAGGGVLDRVIFEMMMALHGILNFKQASDSSFVHQVKSDVLDLMQQHEGQTEAQEGSPEEEQQESPDEEQQEQAQGQGDQGQQAPQQGIAAPQGGMQ